MDDDWIKIARTTIVPVIGAFFLLFVASRACSKKAEPQISETVSTTGLQSGVSTLENGAAVVAGKLPEGLTDEYARYLVENDSAFQSNETVSCSKNADTPSALLGELHSSGAVEFITDPSGRKVASLTPSGQSRLGSVIDRGDSWAFPAESRHVTSFNTTQPVQGEPNKFNVFLTWERVPTIAGAATGIKKETKSGHATFTNNGGHWAASGVSLN